MGKLRPIMVKGHERPLTCVKYNREGDLLFTCAKDHTPCLWYAENGERIGTYQGHCGTVWCLDVNCAQHSSPNTPQHPSPSGPQHPSPSPPLPPPNCTRDGDGSSCCGPHHPPPSLRRTVDSTRLLTGSADNMLKLWDVKTGECLHTWKHTAPIRAVGFAQGDKQFLSVLDNIMGNVPTIFLYELDLKNIAGTPDWCPAAAIPPPRPPTACRHRACRPLPSPQSPRRLAPSPPMTYVLPPPTAFRADCAPSSPRPELTASRAPCRGSPTHTILGHTAKIQRAAWGPLNKAVYSASDDATLRVWDPETGKQTQIVEGVHGKKITDMQFSWDMTVIVTSCADHWVRLFLADGLQLLKQFNTERNINSAAISPLPDCPYLIAGGGQDAMSVTTTAAKQGKFEVTFYDHCFDDELGSVGGHFGPVNTLHMSPDGRGFTSGGEDGYVRIHHLDPEYFEAYKKKVAEAGA